MRILYITTIGGTMSFFNEFIGELVKEGHRVDIACNDSESEVPDFYKKINSEIYSIETSRNPFYKGNLIAIKQIRKLVEEKHYDIVHCHTPIAAMCTRLACRNLRKKGTKVFYTAHGFHFYKGAPIKNWLIYYPIEKICSYWTDVLITINKEDYALAEKKMKAKIIEYVPGVGIDIKKFREIKSDRNRKRMELGIDENEKILLSVGEVNRNKNHQIIIKALEKIKDKSIHYFIAGSGDQKETLVELSKKLNVENQVHLLGYRTDIAELCKASDIFCFPSYREGLGMAAIEAMACGLPLITSNIHGINDYSENNITGYKCNPDDCEGFAKAIIKLSNSSELRNKIGMHNMQFIEKYDIKSINLLMEKIYKEVV